MNPQYIPPQPHYGFGNNAPGYGANPGAPQNAPGFGGPAPPAGFMPPQGQNVGLMRPPMQQGPPMQAAPMGGPPSGPAPPGNIMPPMQPNKMVPPGPSPMGPGSPMTAPRPPADPYVNGQRAGPPGPGPQYAQPVRAPNMPGSMPPGPPGPHQQQYPPAGPNPGPPPGGPAHLSNQMAGLNIGQPHGFPGADPSLKGPVGPPMSMGAPPPVNGVPDPRYPPNSTPQYMNGSPQAMPGPPQPQQQMQSAQPGQMPMGAQMPPSMGGPMAPPVLGMQQMPPYPGQPQHGMPPMPQKQPYPPQPGRMPPQQQEGFQGHMQQPPYPAQSAQQSRRLDPEQMPSPIQVMQEDQRQRSGPFSTVQRGAVPPLVTTNFIVHDQGNSSPRFIRASMYSVPATIDMMKQTAVPFGLVISPLAETLPEELPPPIVDMGELGPVRCIRCKAYMCPMMQFIDGGRRFHCLLCKATSEVPPEYFQHLDHTGQRADRFDRPELMLGTYEFVATKDYCRNNTFPKPPAIIFLIDVSYNNIKSGMVNLLCQELRGILRNLPCDRGQEKPNMKIGIITYSNAVHFYNIKGSLAQPKMMVVGDTNDMFMPLLDGFLCEPSEADEMLECLMEQIPAMFAETRETETILAPAIQAGLEALKASECAGKLLVFHSSLPIAEAPGKLKNRDDRKLLGTDKEKTVLGPQNTFYNNLGQECVAAGCSVDLFLFNNSYVDIATVSQVARLTGGQIYKYTYFQADIDGPRLVADITRNISRNVAFDAIMRVRTSTGVRPTDFCGHFFMSNTTDMELASIDCDKAVAVEVKHDDKLTEEEGVFIQVALLYTSCGGQRRLRVLNLALKTCVQMADLYRGCDLDTIVNFFAKQSVVRLLEHSPKPVKDALVNRCAQMLACYRKNCANPSSAGQLILPECMKLLPLYVNCILKSDAISGGSDLTLDDRSFIMSAVSTMDIPSSVVYFYPRLLPLHELDLNSDTLPPSIRCSSEKLRDDGVYLLENGIHMFLWVGANVAVDWSHSVFGDHLAAKIDIDRTSLPNFDNPLSQRLRHIIEIVRSQRPRSMKLTIIPQRDKLEVVFKHFLVEDRGLDGSASYVEFLCHMHKEIRNLLS